jgi:hypothetical protein
MFRMNIFDTLKYFICPRSYILIENFSVGDTDVSSILIPGEFINLHICLDVSVVIRILGSSVVLYSVRQIG